MRSNIKTFKSFSDAYVTIVTDIINYGKWVKGVTDHSSFGSKFGHNVTRTKEILVYTFCIEDPRKRYLNVKNRNINQQYCLANFLWMLLGTKKASLILRFNKKGEPFLNNKE